MLWRFIELLTFFLKVLDRVFTRNFTWYGVLIHSGGGALRLGEAQASPKTRMGRLGEAQIFEKILRISFWIYNRYPKCYQRSWFCIYLCMQKCQNLEFILKRCILGALTITISKNSTDLYWWAFRKLKGKMYKRFLLPIILEITNIIEIIYFHLFSNRKMIKTWFIFKDMLLNSPQYSEENGFLGLL